MLLTDVETRKAKPMERCYKLSDGLELYLLIGPSGSKLWRCKYRYRQRESAAPWQLPGGPLSKARKLFEARRLLTAASDPMPERKQARLQKRNAFGNSFRAVTQEWMDKQDWSKATRGKAKWTFEQILFPSLGTRPISEITAPKLQDVLSRTELQAKQRTSQVFL